MKCLILPKGKQIYFKMSSAEISTQHAVLKLLFLFIYLYLFFSEPFYLTLNTSHAMDKSSRRQNHVIPPFLSRKRTWTIRMTSRKTRLYNFDPLKPHIYIVKLGFTGIYIIFLISAQKHRMWILVRTASLRRF